MDEIPIREGVTETSGTTVPDAAPTAVGDRLRAPRSRRRRARKSGERPVASAPAPEDEGEDHSAGELVSEIAGDEQGAPDAERVLPGEVERAGTSSPGSFAASAPKGSPDLAEAVETRPRRQPQISPSGEGRSPRGSQRATPLPTGVPSAAEAESLEMPRSSGRPRSEPNNELQQLLRGFEEIQQHQTDRVLLALRQVYTSGESVNGRGAVSTERVGVFVDVPNLVYASRYLNRWIDFGRLLDRVAGGRRIVRAHAYSPTDPDPSAEQQFLSPVKSQGFRVTTKNYRTFASGAKKADMDLDLCMDIVKLVVAHAVDCIVLCSGDGDFLPLIEFCSDNGVRVEVASFMEATSDELRNGCDRFYNLSTMEGIRSSRPLTTAGG
ncbi:MAG: NYN domain-containing protein [Chloroflexi bacterium]|nr:NYN domain-containing protein [Chloroflexota bacterium]